MVLKGRRVSAPVPCACVVAGLVASAPLLGQEASKSPAPPPSEPPSLKVGMTLFTDYTYTAEPTDMDADGNRVRPSAFDVSRAYVNVTGNISRLVSFRITPDVKRLSTSTKGLSGSESVSSSQEGSLTFRIKYAYGQINLDDALTKGSWVRIGTQMTPLIDWHEGIYRYRFQGTMFVDREGFLNPSDFGVSAHYNFPGDFGDLHLGLYNGETFARPEANDRKALQIRGTVRPFPKARVLSGIRLTAFYDADHYVRNAPRRRLVAATTFEHKRIHAGVELLEANDQPSAGAPAVRAQGYSVWITPRSRIGLEGLVRHDLLKPNKDADAKKRRTIVGVAYWFKVQGSALAAVLADLEQVKYGSAFMKPDEKRYALHCLFGF